MNQLKTFLSSPYHKDRKALRAQLAQPSSDGSLPQTKPQIETARKNQPYGKHPLYCQDPIPELVQFASLVVGKPFVAQMDGHADDDRSR